MKREKKQTYTYATRPSVKNKAEIKANKEGVSISEKIDELLTWYIGCKSDNTLYFDNIGKLIIQESNKKKK